MQKRIDTPTLEISSFKGHKMVGCRGISMGSIPDDCPVPSSECFLEYFSINPTEKLSHQSRYPFDNDIHQAVPHQVA